MTKKRKKQEEAAKPQKLATRYSDIGPAALRAALLCLRKADAKPSAGKKAA